MKTIIKNDAHYEALFGCAFERENKPRLYQTRAEHPS
jgi:hypothetical protein